MTTAGLGGIGFSGAWPLTLMKASDGRFEEPKLPESRDGKNG